VTDPIAEALDGFVPTFDSIRGDWQAILNAASLPVAVSTTDRQMPTARHRVWKRGPLARRAVRVVVALAVFAVITTGVAWAAGAFDSPSPQSLFETHFPADSGSGPIFQHVIPGSVKQVASVEIPKVGPVALWHAVTKQGGWCLGLRLSNGSWLGTPPRAGGSPLDGGGAVPGCFPTGVIDGGSHHLEWLENDIDARSVGGSQWRIRSGVITVPGAVKVTDLATGTSTNVVDGDVFVLAIQAPNPSAPPYQSPNLHLVAYDQAGNVVASDCSYHSCSGG
jgi:hypothetical protein